MSNEQERFSRQKEIVPADRLAQCRITIVGTGAIGRQVALQVAAVGVTSLQLVDFDIVEEANLAAQGFWEEDLGKPKVQAVAEHCRRINSNLEVTAVADRFKRSMEVGNVLFCAVDKIETRRMIWESLRGRTECFIDGRMTGEVIRILAAGDHASCEHYAGTLFGAEEAFAGSCTAKSTIFCANIAAGLMIGQFTRWLRRMPLRPDLILNLLAVELTCP